MSAELSQTQSAVLRALCNTFVPALKVANDPIGFWGRSASDMGVDVVIAQQILPALPEPLRAGLLGILDVRAVGGSRAEQELVTHQVEPDIEDRLAADEHLGARDVHVRI